MFKGAAEYITCDDESKLEDYDYVHRCYKFDKDVELRLIPLAQLKRPLLRTGEIININVFVCLWFATKGGMSFLFNKIGICD